MGLGLKTRVDIGAPGGRRFKVEGLKAVRCKIQRASERIMETNLEGHAVSSHKRCGREGQLSTI